MIRVQQCDCLSECGQSTRTCVAAVAFGHEPIAVTASIDDCEPTPTLAGALMCTRTLTAKSPVVASVSGAAA